MRNNPSKPVADLLEECRQRLQEITESTYIPFASPAPSSTEAAIKKQINGALARIENALYLHRNMPYGRKN